MRAEFAAFTTRMEGHTFLAGKVEPGVRLSPGNEPARANYVIVRPAAPDLLNDARYLSRQEPESSARYTFDVRVVATEVEGLLELAGAVLQQLVGYSLVVPGRVCEPVELVAAVEEGRTLRDQTARLFYMDMSFRFWSRRDVWEDEES